MSEKRIPPIPGPESRLEMYIKISVDAEYVAKYFGKDTHLFKLHMADLREHLKEAKERGIL